MGLGPSDRFAAWAARHGIRVPPADPPAGADTAPPAEAPFIDVHVSPPPEDQVAGPTPPEPDFGGPWWRMPPVGERPEREAFPAELLRPRSPRWVRRLRAGGGDVLREPFLRQLAGAIILAAAVLAATSLPGVAGGDAAAAVRWTLQRNYNPVAIARGLVADVPGLAGWLRQEGIRLPAAAAGSPAAASPPASTQPPPGSSTAMGKLVVPLQAPVAVGFGAPVPVPGGGGKTAPSQGVLFWATASAPVHAIAAGQVLAATASATLGRYVLLNHIDGWSSLYAHCESLLVQPGAHVSQGQAVCTTGRVGSRFGPYLYFELRLHGRPVNPAPYLGLVVRGGTPGASTGAKKAGSR